MMAEQIDVAAIRARAMALPEGVMASERDTSHMELSTPDDMWWICLGDDVAWWRGMLADGISRHEMGDRLQLLLDTFASYRPDVLALLARISELSEAANTWQDMLEAETTARLEAEAELASAIHRMAVLSCHRCADGAVSYYPPGAGPDEAEDCACAYCGPHREALGQTWRKGLGHRRGVWAPASPDYGQEVG
jgi:hypothetical protein